MPSRAITSLSKTQWLKLSIVGTGLLLLNQLIEQVLNQSLSQAMRADSPDFLIIASGLFFNGILIVWAQAAVFMTILQPQHPETNSIPLSTKLNDFTREWLRSLGEASLWMFALILPGLIRLIDYMLLPFVCFFCPAYQRGEVDALEACRKLAKGQRHRLWSLWIAFGIIIPLLLTTLFGDYESLFDYPLFATFLITLEACLQVLSAWLLWRIYVRAESQLNGPPSPQSVI